MIWICVYIVYIAASNNISKVCKMITATGPSGAGSLPHHFADARCWLSWELVGAWGFHQETQWIIVDRWFMFANVVCSIACNWVSARCIYRYAQNRTFDRSMCFLARNGLSFSRTPRKPAKGCCRKLFWNEPWSKFRVIRVARGHTVCVPSIQGGPRMKQVLFAVGKIRHIMSSWANVRFCGYS